MQQRYNTNCIGFRQWLLHDKRVPPQTTRYPPPSYWDSGHAVTGVGGWSGTLEMSMVVLALGNILDSSCLCRRPLTTHASRPSAKIFLCMKCPGEESIVSVTALEHRAKHIPMASMSNP